MDRALDRTLKVLAIAVLLGVLVFGGLQIAGADDEPDSVRVCDDNRFSENYCD